MMRAIQIIGGGLAGLSLGIALRRHGVPVRTCEAGSYPRHRVCGEFINGVSDATLENLGIRDLFEDANRLSSTVWYLNDRPFHRSRLDIPAKGISRYRLDQRLADRFGMLGGDLRTQTRLKATDQPGEVWATGRRPDKKSHWLGLKAHFLALDLSADLEMHLGSNGYVGLAPVEGSRVNVCGLFKRQECSGRGIDLLHSYLRSNKLNALNERLRKVEHDPGSVMGVSAFELGEHHGSDLQCLVGDSECMIPPFTGNGMSMAFEAAEMALDPLVDYASNNCGWQETVGLIRRKMNKRFKTRLTAASLLHPFLLDTLGRSFIGGLGRLGVLPFGPLSRLLK